VSRVDVYSRDRRWLNRSPGHSRTGLFGSTFNTISLRLSGAEPVLAVEASKLEYHAFSSYSTRLGSALEVAKICITHFIRPGSRKNG